jgi:two-component system, OmpR family, sensor histidine kinase VanS
MRKSITGKLFIITSVFLLIFLMLTMYFQSTFFDDFYTNRKKNNFENNVKKFNALYSNDFIPNSSLDLVLFQFEESNNARLIIFNNKGTLTAAGNFEIETDRSKINTILKVFNDLSNSPEFLNSIISSKQTIIQDYYDRQFNVKNIICISPVVVNGNTTEIILAVSSLQPIEEASSIIREFYKYILSAALIIAIVMSLIYSNMISKPLISLNKTASKIAEMDFSSHCPVKSDDELGNLAKTLNFLSQKLDSTLKELRNSNARLLEDIEKERHLDRMRKDFIAGVSHELKTPISLISGYAEGLKDDIVDGEAKNFYIDVIMDEANKMSNLVSDMLDLSQLESGNFKLKPSPFNLDDLIEKVVKKLSTFIEEKNINLYIETQNYIEVYADRTRIEQVITNFLTNAIRHTSTGGFIKITATLEKDCVYVEIENSGENIEPENLKNIWDKFYKIDKSRSRNAGGTGLGLSIVKNILLLHKSSFGVKNTKQGVAFYFTLKTPSE